MPVADELAQAGMLAGYTLAPDGLTFSQPATLTLTTPWTEFLPHVVLVSGEKAELLEPTYSVDADANQLSVAVEVSHFSTVVVEKGNIKATISNSGDHFVGAPFDVQVTVTRVTEARSAQLNEDVSDATDRLMRKALNTLTFSETFGPLTVRGDGYFSAADFIVPTRVQAPGANLTADAEPLTFSERFKCSSPGSAVVYYLGGAVQSVKTTGIFFLSSSSGTAEILLDLGSPRFNCLAASPSPPPTKSPSPSPKPPTPSPGADLLTQMAGTYDVIRTFDANSCGYGTYTGEATLRTGEGGLPYGIYFGMVTDTPLLSHMDYRGNAAVDGSFQATEVDPAFYDAKIIGRFANGIITFTEQVTMFRDDSPCKGQTFTTSGTATKK